jgi:hypothetical protein
MPPEQCARHKTTAFRRGIAMVDVKEAVRTAREYAADMLGDLPNLELEEVELSDDERYWIVTLGFDSKEVDPFYSRLGSIGDVPRLRKYKVFKVHTDDGKVKSMKIRETSKTDSQQ